jgi:hypothetical protein
MSSDDELSDAELIVQLRRDSEVDRNFRANPPPSLANGRVALDHIAEGPAPGQLGPPEAGDVVMSVLSAEGLRSQQDELRQVVSEAPTGDEPLVIIVEAAEELREDELHVVLDAAILARRAVILRVQADA